MAINHTMSELYSHKNARSLLYTQEMKPRNTHKIPEDDGVIVHQLAAVETVFTMLFHQHLQLFAQNNWTQVRKTQCVLDNVHAAR